MTIARKLSTLFLFVLMLAAPFLANAQTTVSLSVNPTQPVFGATATLQAVVTPATATGRVTFYDGVTVLGTKALVSGVATLSTILLPAGSHKLKAYYPGDGANAVANSNTLTPTITPQASAGLASRSPLSVTATALLAIGDFNNDGKVDLVFRNAAALTVLLGDGTGNFITPGYSITIGGLTPVAAAVADFNGDGFADLVLGSSTSSTVSILLGKGDGTFQAPVSYPVSNAVSGVAVADFNGDGKVDVATADSISGINILLGNGDGTLQTAVPHLNNPSGGGGFQATYVVVADFNGDGKADLATANANGANLSVMLGAGDGNFQTPIIVTIPSTTLRIAVGEFNGDGKPDLVTSNGNVLYGKGDGTFLTPVTYATGSNPNSVAVGDVNGDGYADLIFSDGIVSILYGNAAATFGAPSIYTLSGNATSVLVSEFSSDRKTDLALVSGTTPTFLMGTTVAVVPTGGSPQSTAIRTPFAAPLQVTVKDGNTPVSGVTVTFTAPSGNVSDTFPNGAPTATLSSGTAVTDINGVASVSAVANGISGNYNVTATALGVSTAFSLTNLVGTNLTMTLSPNTPQSTLRNTAFPRPLQVTLKDSTGLPATGVTVTFTPSANGASATLSSNTAVTNASGVASVTATANNVTGSYTITASAAGLSGTFSLTNLQSLAVTLVSSANPSNFGSPLVLTATTTNPAGVGKMTFYDGVSIIGTKPVTAGVATFSTVLLAAGSHSITAYYRDDSTSTVGLSNILTETIKAAAGGAFITQSPLSLSAVGKPVMGDFNNDGKVDLAFATQVNASLVLNVMLGNGDGTFQTAVPYATGSGNVTSLAVGDFNGDGNTDLVVTTFVPVTTPAGITSANVLLGNGDGSFRPFVSYQTGAILPISATIVGDFNNDGKADLLFAFSASSGINSSGGVNLSLGNGDGTFGTPNPYSLLLPPIGLTDLNGDGKADVVLGNNAANNSVPTASPFVLLGNGDGSAQSPIGFSIGTNGVIASTILSGDFNGDGKIDIAVGGQTNLGAPATWILLGNGDGTFQPAVRYDFGAAVSTGDFNGDGILDLVASNATGTAIMQGIGDGTFFLRPSTNVTANSPLLVADFNGDGKADILTSSVNNGALTVLLGASSVAVSLTATGGATQSAATGTPFAQALQVTALNNGIPLSGVTITFTPPATGAGATLSSLTAVTNAAGIASVTATANFVPGSYTVVASYQNSNATFNLTNTSFAFITATNGTPQTTTVGTAFTNSLQATVKDAIGNPVPGVTVTFGGPASGASAVLSATTAVTNAAGIATVTATANSIAGSYVVSAVAGTLSASFQLTNAAGPPANVVASGGATQSALLGTAFGTALQATVKDASGNPVSGATVTFTVPSAGASATLSSATAVTNASGVASVTATANNTAGAYTVTASVGGLSIPFALTNTTIASVTATGGNGQSALVGTAFVTALQATVKDTAGNPVSGITVTFAVPVSGAGASLSSATAVTNASGVASVSATANTTPGTYTVTASVGNLSANFTLTNTAGAAATIAPIAGTPQSAIVGTSFAVPLQVVVKDASGTPINGATVTFAAPVNGASAFLSSTTVTTNASGIASVNATANNLAGSYIVTATAGSVSTSFSLNNLLNTGTSNLALGKATAQSSTLPGTSGPGAAVDGNTDGGFYNGSVTHTNTDANAWWQVDLGGPANISSIVIWNRTDCCSDRLSDYWVFVSNTPFLSTDTPATLQNRPGTTAIHQTTAPNPFSSVAPGNLQGQYVRVQLSGTNNLSLAEVQVNGTLTGPVSTNLAVGKTATQSSTLAGYPSAVPGSAVDGNTDGNFFNNSVTHTNADANAWWQVDLGASATISTVVVWGRTDACCISRLSDYWVFVSDTPFQPTDTPATLVGRANTASSHQTGAPNPSTTITFGAQGRYVRVQLSGTNNLSLAEVQVFGTSVAATNIAVGKTAAQSSTLPGYPTDSASAAVDGNTNGNFFAGSVTHTNADQNAWWQVDLGASATVNSVVVWNRTDCCGSRLTDYWVFISDTPFLATDTPATLQARAGTTGYHQTTAPSPATTITTNTQGRYVRVQLSGTGNLSLAEVQIFGSGAGVTPPRNDLAIGKAVSQSSTLPGTPSAAPGSANDGNIDGNFYNNSVTHTNPEPNAWWQVDLGASTAINSVVVWNRTDCCGTRLGDYWVFVSDVPFLTTDTPATLMNRVGTFASHQTSAPNPSTSVPVVYQGRYVRIQLSGTTDPLSLAEVQVFGQ